jgi:hypothetical protein
LVPDLCPSRTPVNHREMAAAFLTLFDHKSLEGSEDAGIV